MNRRQYLLTAGSSIPLLAGCVASSGSEGPNADNTGPLDPVAGTWPTYQFDSARTGHVPEQGTPPEDRTGGWTTPVNVSRTPAVADGTVYVGGLDGYVAALDATTGEETWRFEADAGGDATSWATPIPSDEALYTHGDSGVFALDRETGEPNWRVEPEVERLRPRTMALVDDALVVERGGIGVAALDSESGEQRWRYDFGDYALQSPLAVAGGTLFATAVDNTVHAVDVATGKRRWRQALGPGRLRGLSVADGTAYLTSHVLYAVDVASGDLKWTLDVREATALEECPDDDGQSGSGGSPASQPAVADRLLFFRFESCHVVAVETETGEVAWTTREPGARRAPVMVGGRLYVTGTDAIVALDPATGNRTGQTFGTPERPSTAPVVVDGVAFVGTDGPSGDVLVASTAG